MNVLVPMHGFVRWNGGLDLTRLIVSAVERAPCRNIVLSFAIPTPSLPHRIALASLRRWQAFSAGTRASSGGRSALIRSAREMIGHRHMIDCSDSSRGILDAARSAKADVIFPSLFPLGKYGPPRVGYIFDLQHRYLPELFPKRIRKSRDRKFKHITEDATGIVVNSRAVAHDIERMLDYPPSRILTMPFAPYASSRWLDLDPSDAQASYNLHGRYLLVCNHFWKHKDHATALRAFSLLHGLTGNEDLQLVMTGDPIDHRDPRHYGKLRSLASELGITASTHFLGLIPKRDQLALLRGSSALLQPTRFEGGPGGGSVYEAIGLGIPAIVSDIPVNLEIDQGDVRFFHAGDAEDLAARAAEVLANPMPRPDRESLLAQGDANLARLGNAICDYLVNLLCR